MAILVGAVDRQTAADTPSLRYAGFRPEARAGTKSACPPRFHTYIGTHEYVFDDVPEAPAFLDWNSGRAFYGAFEDATAMGAVAPETAAAATRT